MGLRSFIGRTTRWITWPAIVVIALNIESWATDNGLGDLLQNPSLLVPDMIVSAYQFLLQPWVIYVSTFVAGCFFYEWVAQISARIDRRSPKYSWMLTKVYAANVKSGFAKPGFSRWMLNRYDYVGVLNDRLEDLGLPKVPEEITDNEGLNRAYAQYVGMIGEGDWRLAHAFFQRVIEPGRLQAQLPDDRTDPLMPELVQSSEASEP
jgi:hypothetical protein